MDWPKVKIGDLVESISKWNPKASPSALPFTYIDLSSIDKERKLIHDFVIVHPSEAPSRARQLVQENDVLVSTVRPNLNGVAMIGPEYNGATASTGYCVLRPIPEKILPSFLFHWVKTSHFIREMTRNSTGANYPAVSEKAVKQHLISLPPMDEQKRIAAILDKADEIKQNIQKMKDIKKQTELSIFLDMFGDPVANSKGWNVQKLVQITDGIRSGSTPKGGSKNYVDDGIPFFRSQNVWRNKIEFSDVAYIDEKMHSSMKKTSLKRNDILITKTGRINTENSSLGRAALFTGEDDTANINGHVYFIRLSDASYLHEFVVYILTTDIFREYIRSVCVGGIDKRQLNKEHIENFPIISPPLHLQEKFISIINTLSLLTKNNRKNLSLTLSNSVTQEMLT